MAMKRPNFQRNRMSGNCDVLDGTDLLEEILFRVPHEFIFNCILVSKRWFDLICGSCFRENYISRWSDKVNLLQHQLQFEPSAEVSELQHQLQSQQLAALNQLQHRLQSQQLAALDQLQHRLAVNQWPLWNFCFLNESLHRLHSERVVAVNEFHRLLELAAENQSEKVIDHKIWDALDAALELKSVNRSQQGSQSEVLGVVKELLQELPCQRWAAVNEVQHQIVCQLLVVVNDVQCEQYWDMIFKPFSRCLMYQDQLEQMSSGTNVVPSTTPPRAPSLV